METFFPSQFMFCRSGFAVMERHVDTSGWRWVRKFPTYHALVTELTHTKCQAAKMADSIFFFFFFFLHLSPLCSLSSCFQGFQCVNWQQSSCIQACFCAGHVVSHTVLITRLGRNWFVYNICPFIVYKYSSWYLKHISAIYLKVFYLRLSPLHLLCLNLIFTSLTHRSALQSLHKACEVARCHNYFPGSLFLTWVSYYQSRVSSDQTRINEWNAMQDVQSHRADSPVLFSDV